METAFPIEGQPRFLFPVPYKAWRNTPTYLELYGYQTPTIGD